MSSSSSRSYMAEIGFGMALSAAAFLMIQGLTVGADYFRSKWLSRNADKSTLPPGLSASDMELALRLQRDISKSNEITFQTISGLADPKRILHESLVLPRMFPDQFKGARRPWRGVLLHGPPGTGKTLLAKAVASECGTTFFSVSAASLASKWLGESERMVRVLFAMARHNAPATIFIDEIDAIAGQNMTGGHQSHRLVKGELLAQMDGLHSSGDSWSEDGKIFKGVLVIAASNHPWDLDTAVLRRLEKRVHIPLPDPEARKGIIIQALEGINTDPDLDLDDVVANCRGFSGHDVANVVRDAMMMPIREATKNMAAKVRAAAGGGLEVISEKCHAPVTQAHFNTALARTNTSVCGREVLAHQKWSSAYGSS